MSPRTKPSKPDIRNQLVERTGDDNLLFADGFDDAIIGVTSTTPLRVVYSQAKMIRILSKDMTKDEAIEHLGYNVFDADVGERTPLYIDLVR